jgi:hypothetical protein
LRSALERQSLLQPMRRIDWSQRSIRDAIVIFFLAMLAAVVSEYADFFVTIVRFQSIYGDWGLDDAVMICVVLSFALTA